MTCRHMMTCIRAMWLTRMLCLCVDNIQFIHEFICLLIQFKALNILFVCMLSYFECISITLCNFML